jgi:hypothetical protein
MISWRDFGCSGKRIISGGDISGKFRENRLSEQSKRGA